MKKLTKDKFGFFLLIFNIILWAGGIGYFCYSMFLLKKIETILRMLIVAALIIISIIFITLIIKSLFKRKRFRIIVITLLSILIFGGLCFISFNISKVYNILSTITTDSQSFSSSLVVRGDSNINSIEDISSLKIGILEDTESVDGYQIPQEIINENNLSNELVKYDNYLDLINALLHKKVDVVFLPTNYSILFASVDGFEDLGETTKIIYTKDKNVKVQKTLGTKNLTEPFTVLLMGVDSEKENIKGSSFNGDSLVLITFNPKKLSATILSIPRDTYTPIACFAGQKRNKITHAAWYGESCMIKTIQNMLDVKIDYYVKINFKGIVKLVDSLGGVDVDVPYNFCEQNSNRKFGNDTVYVRKGFQSLNGEQALALARNRHPWTQYCSREWTNYNSNDFVRGQNQQLVIQGMLNKIKNVNSIDTFYSMLDSVSQSMETNMSTENILSFYNVAKDILIKNTSSNSDLSSLIGFQRLYLSGYDQTIVDYDSNTDSGSKLALYNFIPYQGSINDISRAMKINLGLLNDDPVKSFDFDINSPFEEHVIGKGRYSDGGIAILPSFVGRNLSEVQNYCSSRGITLNVQKEKTISSSFDGLVSTQSLPAGMDVGAINKTKGLSVTVYEYEKKDVTIVPGIPDVPVDPIDPDNGDNTTDPDNGETGNNGTNNGSSNQTENGNQGNDSGESGNSTENDNTNP